MQDSPFADTYGQVLSHYLGTRGEDALYRASLLSQTFVEQGVGPEEIIALHFEQLDRALNGMSYREQARSIGDAHQFLLEVMIAYGVTYREYLEIRVQESLKEAEARADLERQRALEREQHDREKQEILEHIAHELGTPITAAMGTLDLAQRSLSRGHVDRVQPLIGSAREAVDRLSRLTAQLVQASRGELPHLDRTPQDLGDLVSQACSWASAAAAARGIQFDYSPEPEDIAVLGDADALLSVFGNLLSNAVRYTDAGGSVSVHLSAEEDMAWVEIRDTGIGMTQEVQARIFERFYRSPDARGHDAQGLGLGLALVKDLLEAHSGTIVVESAPGQGSTFRVALPVLRHQDGSQARVRFGDGRQTEE